jgi:hypothetical protein
METETLKNITYLTKESILYPNRLFADVNRGKLLKEISLVFCFGAIITFIKSFFQEGQIVNFFEDNRINNILGILSIPQVLWIISYVSYFIFIFIMLMICRLFNKKTEPKRLALAIMSLSAIGVVMQILFFAFKFILPQEYLIMGSNIIYLWVIILTVFAIKATQKLPFIKSIICFLIPALPFIFLVYLSGMAPYLMWLGY